MRIKGFVSAARGLLGLKQTELGRLLKVHQVSIAQWETGTREPGTQHLNRLLKIVARELLEIWVRDITAADTIMQKLRESAKVSELSAESPSRLRKVLRRRAQLFALTLLSGGSAHLRKEEWCDLLRISPRLLRDVPTDEQFLCAGGDVGTAIIASHRGLKYRDLVAGEPGPMTERMQRFIGEERIHSELRLILRMQEVRKAVTEALEAEERKP
jgi:transcriptional regulator with XRE-family HTH domain